MRAVWLMIAALGVGGCEGAAVDANGSLEEDARQCKRYGRHCAMPDGGTVADLAQAPVDLAHATDLASAPDLARPADLAQAPADLASAPDLSPASTCDKLVSTSVLGANADGHHHAGEECMSCHSGAGGAPKWTAAGTLYNAASGGVAVAGATVHVVDANGVALKLITGTNGNFWTGTALAYPIKVSASLCPYTDLSMSGAVSAPGGCNSCHGSTFRVHLP